MLNLSCTKQRLQIGKLPVFCPPLSNSFPYRERRSFIPHCRRSVFLPIHYCIQSIVHYKSTTILPGLPPFSQYKPLTLTTLSQGRRGVCVSSVAPPTSTPSASASDSERNQAKKTPPFLFPLPVFLSSASGILGGEIFIFFSFQSLTYKPHKHLRGALVVDSFDPDNHQ
ncbi:hypothetical protein F4806DRAFT_292243 [Annulohypoxylon nitens]|nr:hypothetical protein F4806DRAFT_292243 [Annulohypoxylon nitens]